MTEAAYRKLLTRFLHNYWGAFHEVLEAQSVTPRRLARSLFNALESEHRAFAAMYSGPAQPAVDDLTDLWEDMAARQHEFVDPALTRKDVVRALRQFSAIYDSLIDEGAKFAAARRDILKHAPHGTPNEPLHADAAR